MTATDLLLANNLDLPDLRGALDSWLAVRSAEQAVSDMAEAARRLDDPALRNIALAVLAEIGVELAEPRVRRMTEEPQLRGWITCWLVDHGLDPAASRYDPADIDPSSLAGPDDLADALALAGDHVQQIALLERLQRVPSAATLAVPEAMGRTHPVKAVAKAARKAALQHRSWMANPGGEPRVSGRRGAGTGC